MWEVEEINGVKFQCIFIHAIRSVLHDLDLFVYIWVYTCGCVSKNTTLFVHFPRNGTHS